MEKNQELTYKRYEIWQIRYDWMASAYKNFDYSKFDFVVTDKYFNIKMYLIRVCRKLHGSSSTTA